MGLAERRKLYASIEQARGRHLIAVFLSTRQGFQAIMAQDILPSIFRQIRKLPTDDRGVDILIDSLGGDADVAIRINDVLRESDRSVNVLVPRSAFSAATMLALGASKILMHPLACLGPIDPQLVVAKSDGTRDQIGAEDIKAFVQFVNHEVRLTDQTEVAAVFSRLFDDVRPVQLGVARRASKRSVAIAEEMLSRHIKEGDARTKIALIAERLAGGYHAHGHPISPREAKQIGLPVDIAAGAIADELWALVDDADATMEAGKPVQPFATMMQEWEARRARWQTMIQATTQPQGNPPTAIGVELDAARVSFEVPFTFQLSGRIGLVESTRCANECNMTAHYIGSVSPANGGRVFGGPPSVVWETVD